MNDAKAKKLFVMGNDGKPKRLIVLEFDGGEHHAYKTSSWHKLTLKDGTPLGIPEQKIELGREIMHKTKGRGLVIMLSDDHATFGSMMHKVGQAYHKIQFGGGHASDHIKKNASDPLRHQGELIVFLDHGQDMSAADEDGFSDPYVKLVSGGLSVNSRVVPKTLNPSWKQELKLVGVLEDFIATGLLLKVSDSDGAAFLDDYLGNVFLSLEHLRESHVDRLFEEQLDTSGKLVFRVGWDEYEPAISFALRYDNHVRQAHDAAARRVGLGPHALAARGGRVDRGPRLARRDGRQEGRKTSGLARGLALGPARRQRAAQRLRAGPPPVQDPGAVRHALAQVPQGPEVGQDQPQGCLHLVSA